MDTFSAISMPAVVANPHVDWTSSPVWVAGSVYDSPDISALVAYWKNTLGGVLNDYIGFVIKNNGTTTDIRRQHGAYGHATPEILQLTYSINTKRNFIHEGIF